MARELPVSAVVVTLNEGHLLGPCLESIQFCDEIIVVDIGSTDDSVAVAERHGARVVRHPRVPVADEILYKMADQIRNEWLVTTDPDERISPQLAAQLVREFATLSVNAGTVAVPCQFYFRDRPLRGTVWGGIVERRLFVHTKRARVAPHVHQDITATGDHLDVSVSYDGGNVLHHLWMTGYAQWIEKHHRYARLEGPVRYARGERFSARRLVTTLPNAFYYSFVTRRGYRDGLVGLLLSVFWAWYNAIALWSLRRAEREQGRLAHAAE